ncbi:hypothetical protein Bb109J_c2490 [Bdellovibrio bacteriovorus]|nr:hypothetical protein EP01_09540 [Bdellovibrio bacteriovorus]BEV69070.1 hypothetical protein Bb109J_c2490 [Bdellovibrio bacteriovorus]
MEIVESVYTFVRKISDMKKNLEAILKKKGMNLNQVSKVAQVPKSTIYSWSDQKSVNLKQLRAVAQALGVSVHELAYGEPDPHVGIGTEFLEELFSGDVRISIHRLHKEKKDKEPL